MSTLAGRTLFITGASRGIGKAIGLRAARDGANVVIAAKSDRPHRTLPGTIHSAAEEIRAAGGRALPLAVDVRDDAAVRDAVAHAIDTFGGIDVLVNNASAIRLTGTLDTPMRRYDLMFDVNVRATFSCSQACIPALEKSSNAHILNLAPPLDMDPRWFRNHTAYTMAKYGMSMCVLGMSEELREKRIAVNALWPRTIILTAALAELPGIEPAGCRKPEIVADAARAILTRDAARCTGNFFIDEAVLRESGVEEFESYAVEPGAPLQKDLFVRE